MSGGNPYGRDSRHHVLSVLVENRPGVLARVSALFARRGYNIFSLVVAPTEHPDFSRFTIVVDLASAPLEQMVRQLFKLVEVLRISELDPMHSVERELAMVTVKASPEQRGRVIELTDIFEGRILAVGGDALTVSLDASPSRIDDFMSLLDQYGIVESQRTGLVALPKLDRPVGSHAVGAAPGSTI